MNVRIHRIHFLELELYRKLQEGISVAYDEAKAVKLKKIQLSKPYLCNLILMMELTNGKIIEHVRVVSNRGGPIEDACCRTRDEVVTVGRNALKSISYIIRV